MRASRTLAMSLAREILQYSGLGFAAVCVVLITQNLLRRMDDLTAVGFTFEDLLVVLVDALEGRGAEVHGGRARRGQQVLGGDGTRHHVTTRQVGVVDLEQLAEETDGAFLPRQFSNEHNSEAHYEGTGPEIWWQLGAHDLTPDAFVSDLLGQVPTP